MSGCLVVITQGLITYALSGALSLFSIRQEAHGLVIRKGMGIARAARGIFFSTSMGFNLCFPFV